MLATFNDAERRVLLEAWLLGAKSGDSSDLESAVLAMGPECEVCGGHHGIATHYEVSR
jgi:hypothetical protein